VISLIAGRASRQSSSTTSVPPLCTPFDNRNSLHTNAFDEAITTPTPESVRRAVAIQMIINQELGLNFCENPWQGSFIVDELTDLVEEAVYQEFERISERGGVLGAMDTMCQRGKIQEQSLYYERKKHDGSLPIVGVNTFLPPPASSTSRRWPVREKTPLLPVTMKCPPKRVKPRDKE
jgi:methylmalonyl-CoA mutase